MTGPAGWSRLNHHFQLISNKPRRFAGRSLRRAMDARRHCAARPIHGDPPEIADPKVKTTIAPPAAPHNEDRSCARSAIRETRRHLFPPKSRSNSGASLRQVRRAAAPDHCAILRSPYSAHDKLITARYPPPPARYRHGKKRHPCQPALAPHPADNHEYNSAPDPAPPPATATNPRATPPPPPAPPRCTPPPHSATAPHPKWRSLLPLPIAPYFTSPKSPGSPRTPANRH